MQQHDGREGATHQQEAADLSTIQMGYIYSFKGIDTYIHMICIFLQSLYTIIMIKTFNDMNSMTIYIDKEMYIGDEF